MRVETIDIGTFNVRTEVIQTESGAFDWVAVVSERNGAGREVLSKRGACGHVSRGDALDIAATEAQRLAAELSTSNRLDR